MEYKKQFELDYAKDFGKIVKDYQGERDATLLINCLLGLLVVPNESYFNEIPQDPVDTLANWGISPNSIITFGNERNGNPRAENLQQLVRSLRNSVGHFKVSPIHERGVVKGFDFKDRYGFHAEIVLQEMRVFVERLAQHLESQV